MSALETELTECRRVICRQPMRAEFTGWTTGERDGIWLTVRPDAAPDKRVTVHSFHVNAEPLPEPSGPRRFWLPLPPSINVYWNPVNGVLRKSEEARLYLARCETLLAVQKVRPIKGDVLLELTIYRARRSGDLDNYCKGILDALKGYAYCDDGQIAKMIVERVDAPAGQTKAAKEARAQWRARVEVTVSAMKGED